MRLGGLVEAEDVAHLRPAAALYELTPDGHRHLEHEVQNWHQYSAAIDRELATSDQEI